MSSDHVNRIWRPVVRSTNVSVPEPGTLPRSGSSQELYTKTSLKKIQDEEYERLVARNCNIVSVTQAFNNTPKPFNRAESGNQPSSSCRTSLLRSSEPSNFEGDIRHRSSQGTLNTQLDKEPLQTPEKQVNSESTNMSNMTPKLIHNQYNSPLDLYSMSNIRKTIEAHTELIAPGLKGINFMKSDTPVNKQSEVYKLVREEEERERRSNHRQSPISGESSRTNNLNLIDSSRNEQLSYDVTNSESSSYQASSSHLAVHQSQLGTRDNGSSVLNQQVNQSSQNRPPSCSECGRSIVGPFAKVGTRFVHPHCFNCSTCGTSLKNNGYFTINEKLYCEIHAKQVANMMKIRYDFEAKRQLSTSGLSSQHLVRPQEPTINLHQEKVSLDPTSTTYGARLSNNTSPATISTMFADRSNSETSDDRRESNWAWRSSSGIERNSPASSQTTNSTLKVGTGSSAQLTRIDTSGRQQSASSHLTRQDMQFRQPMISHMALNEMETQTVARDAHQTASRIPVCNHCRMEIHGPYILAGKTTWCKYCSQTHFNCHSCRRSLLDIGFIEDSLCKYYCECCYEAYYAPICHKCNIRIKGDCLNALGKQWHPSCFVCGHCRRPFGNSSFYLEDNVPYCERDWKLLFTTKCHSCGLPIEAGDRWIEALDKSYHTNCFKCSGCQVNLEGSTFHCKGGKPYCRMHAR